MPKKTLDPEEVEKTPVLEIMKFLGSSEKGLSGSEVKKRLEQYGYNDIAEKKVNPLLRLLGYFWGPIPWMIEVAAVLSLAVRHWADFIIIAVLLVFNALVGFWQEYKAGNAVEALKKQLALFQETLPIRLLALVGRRDKAAGHPVGGLSLRPAHTHKLAKRGPDLGLLHGLDVYRGLGEITGL